MSLNKFVRDYLSFSRRERIGAIFLLALLLFIFFLPSFMRLLPGRKPLVTDTAWGRYRPEIRIPPLNEENHDRNTHPAAGSRKNDDNPGKIINPGTALFSFDPNTLPAGKWKILGLRDQTIRIIQNYRNKGGRFRKPEDLQKVYGLKQNEYDRLAPYIQIENKEDRNISQKPPAPTKKEWPGDGSRTRYGVIDINSADTTAFINLPGIGSRLAARIVNFRNRLGGFYTVDQLKETYGLPDSVFNKIKTFLSADSTTVKKININKATKEELKGHPYIKWNIANALIEYRNQHGNFTSVSDIRKIQLIDEVTFNRLVYYISL